MSNKSIEPARSRDFQITPRTRPRGLWGQVWTVALQPGYFFRTIPLLADTRSWLWAAILILALTGLSAVQQDTLTKANTDSGGSFQPDFGGAPPGTDISGGGGGIISGGFEVGPVGVPGDGDSGIPPSAPSAGGSPDVTTTWTIALVTAAGVILGWIALTILLSEVTLLNGRPPIIGQNFQVAIWASLPLALMATLQLVYYAAGGTVGESGLSGLLADWEAYNGLSPFLQSLILSLTSRLTLFWLWSLILIYIGARNALNGKRFAAALVVVAWAIVLVVAPVVAGTIEAPESLTPADSGEMLPDLSEGEMPSGLSDPFDTAPDGNIVEVTPDAGIFEIVTAEPGEFSGESGEMVITELEELPSEIAVPTLPPKRP